MKMGHLEMCEMYFYVENYPKCWIYVMINYIHL